MSWDARLLLHNQLLLQPLPLKTPEGESRGKPQAKPSGAQTPGSTAANPETIEVEGVHVSTPGISRIQTEEIVEERINLSAEERLDLHQRKEFVSMLEKFTTGLMGLDIIAKMVGSQ